MHALGPFVFTSFSRADSPRGGPPELPGEVVETIQRPGVDGTAFVLQGARGRPFAMRSFADCATLAAAQAEGRAYVASRGANPLVLVWDGTDYYATHGVLYVVVEVAVERIVRIAAAAGRLRNAAPQAALEASWTLVPIRA